MNKRKWEPGNPDFVIQHLLGGNQRYCEGKVRRNGNDQDRRTATAYEQHPFAAVLSCSDSRIMLSEIFDCRLGDLFVCRVAGNIADTAVIGSLEYAAEHLGSSVIVVMGHERCGAVGAACKSAGAPGHILSLVEQIRPAVKASSNQPGDLVENAVRENVRQVVNRLRESEPILAHMVKEGKLKVVGAYYYLESGRVELLDYEAPAAQKQDAA
ncbi:carbonic anhydrase [bacterium]|nr:carbonic anhydrase [bacterium]